MLKETVNIQVIYYYVKQKWKNNTCSQTKPHVSCNEDIELVTKFEYFGSIINDHGDYSKEVRSRQELSC